MTLNKVAEIDGYLKHGDYGVAVRRLLDTCLDAGDDNLTEKAIAWSKEYHQSVNSDVDKTLPHNFLGTANGLLEKLEQLPPVNQRPAALLTAVDISKTYNSSPFSLRPISLSVSTGDVLGVVGENGNGKTTLLRCIAGQLALNNGTLQYHLLTNPDEYAIKNHIAFIPQRIPKWYGGLKDNLHFSAAISGVTGAKNDLMVDFMLERLNLTRFAQLNWSQISSGYRTRFEIARILLQKPRLLILDEPLANLDINAQQTILTDLIFMAKGAHNPMGIVLSSQQLHEVEKVADSVLFIKNGQCIYSNQEEKKKITSYAIELETVQGRDELLQLFNDSSVEVQYNGGFYTLISTTVDAQAMMERLVIAKVPMTYFRDITYSTKRYFNN